MTTKIVKSTDGKGSTHAGEHGIKTVHVHTGDEHHSLSHGYVASEKGDYFIHNHKTDDFDSKHDHLHSAIKRLKELGHNVDDKKIRPSHLHEAIVDEAHEDELLEQIRADLIEQAAFEEIELDEEQLDELSKQTLHSYAAKAKGSAAASRKIAKISSDRDEPDRAAKFADKAKKRDAGAKKATKKLSESIEEMIAAAHEGKPVEFAAAFNTALRDVIDTKMDDMRATAAASLFEPKE